MPYVPPDVKERIKREVSIQRLAEARGIKLTRSGKELIGLCPFHDDRNPSLNIDPVKNVWSCKGACGEGGDVILWVMRAEGVSFHHALELLKRDHFPLAAGPIQAVKTEHGAEAAAADRRHGGRQKAAGNRGGLLPPDAERLAGGAAVSRQARPSILGDHRPVPAGLRQPHAVPASAGVEPRRRRCAADAAERAWHPAQPEAGSRALQRFAGYPGVQSGRRSGGDVRAEDHAESARRERRYHRIFRGSTGACGTKRR